MAIARITELELLGKVPKVRMMGGGREGDEKKVRDVLDRLARDASGGARVEVFDDWMTPDLRSGDLAYLDDAKRIYAEGIYAFHYQGKPHIKRITTLPSGKLCLSVNERTDSEQQYPAEFSFNKSFIVTLKEVEVIGRVVFAWRNMDGR